MGYTFCCCDVGIFSPLFRLKDFVSALMGWIDLLSDVLTTKKYKDDCNDENSDVPCTYFYLSIIFMCLPSIAVTIIMLAGYSCIYSYSKVLMQNGHFSMEFFIRFGDHGEECI